MVDGRGAVEGGGGSLWVPFHPFFVILFLCSQARQARAHYAAGCIVALSQRWSTRDTVRHQPMVLGAQELHMLHTTRNTRTHAHPLRQHPHLLILSMKG